MKRYYCVYGVTNNIDVERLVLKRAVHVRVCMQQDRAMPARRIMPCPEQMRIINFFYHHLCLSYDSRTNVNLFLSFFRICASELGYLKAGRCSTAKMAARVAPLAKN